MKTNVKSLKWSTSLLSAKHVMLEAEIESYTFRDGWS